MKLIFITLCILGSALVLGGIFLLICEDDWCLVMDWQKIKVTSPLPNTVIKSPLKVSGEARGNWYFEASFPVFLLDGDGKEIAVVPAQAKSDWMTKEFVSFEAMLTFQKPKTKIGTLIFKKDNPSGLPEHDDSISIPVLFDVN